MPLNASGPIAIAGTTTGVSIELELGGNGTTMISINDTNVRSLAGILAGNPISFNNFYGKSLVNITFGLLIEPHINGGGNGIITKVTYATDTFSEASITNQHGTNAGGPCALNNQTLGLLIGQSGTSVAYKINTVDGIYFATLVKFSAAVTAQNTGMGVDANNGNTGWVIGGNVTWLTNSLEFNLATITNSIIASGFAKTAYHFGSDGKLATYCLGQFDPTTTTAKLTKWVYSTKTQTIFTFTWGSGGNVADIANCAYSSPTNSYFRQGYGVGSTTKLNRATETTAVSNIANPPNNVSAYGATGAKILNSNLAGYMWNLNQGATGNSFYYLGVKFTYATDTNVGGYAAPTSSSARGAVTYMTESTALGQPFEKTA